MILVFAILVLFAVTVCGTDVAPQAIPVEDPAHDECPDTFQHPLEYPSIPRFASTTVKSDVTNAMCTLITQCSVDRFDNLYQQALAWNGPISAAIYVSTTSDTEIVSQTTAVAALVSRLNKDDKFQGSLTFSLLFGHENTTWTWKCDHPEAIGAPLYPINALRNLATAAAASIEAVNATTASTHARPTPLMFLADADFIPSPGLLQWASKDTVVERCNKGELIVIPAFEAKDLGSSGQPTLQFMLDGMKKGNVFQFHKRRFSAGHAPTNYDRWAQHSRLLVPGDALSARTYTVLHHKDYEPYVILSREKFTAYDERFRGYGQNKVVQLKWLHARGATFHVLPGHFVVAASHERPQLAAKAMKANSITRVAMMQASRTATKDMEEGKLPLVSNTTAALLTAAGLNHSSQHV